MFSSGIWLTAGFGTPFQILFCVRMRSAQWAGRREHRESLSPNRTHRRCSRRCRCQLSASFWPGFGQFLARFWSKKRSKPWSKTMTKTMKKTMKKTMTKTMTKMCFFLVLNVCRFDNASGIKRFYFIKPFTDQ